MAGTDTPQKNVMDSSTLRALLDSEKMSALAAYHAGQLSLERAKALDYYYGDVSSDIPNETDTSNAVSTDVFDTVEGMLPSLMEIFVGGDEVVRFDPTGPGDVEAAQQETDYVNHVFMQQNPGFNIIYTMIKDALLSKVGIVKVYWEERTDEERNTYYDLTDAQFAIFASDPEVEIIEHTAKDRPEDGDPDSDPVLDQSYT